MKNSFLTFFLFVCFTRWCVVIVCHISYSVGPRTATRHNREAARKSFCHEILHLVSRPAFRKKWERHFFLSSSLLPLPPNRPRRTWKVSNYLHRLFEWKFAFIGDKLRRQAEGFLFSHQFHRCEAFPLFWTRQRHQLNIRRLRLRLITLVGLHTNFSTIIIIW